MNGRTRGGGGRGTPKQRGLGSGEFGLGLGFLLSFHRCGTHVVFFFFINARRAICSARFSPRRLLL